MSKDKKDKSKKKKRLIFNPFLWMGIFFLLFIITFYVAIPIAVKSIASNYVKENYDRDLEIGSFSLNPFGFDITIDNLILYDTDGEVFVKWKRFYVNPEIIPMMSNEIIIDKVSMIGYEINVRKFKDEKFNFSDFLEQKGDSTAIIDSVEVKDPNAEPWIIRLNELKIAKMDLKFNDKSASPELSIGIDNFNSSVQNFTINTSELTDWNVDFMISGGKIASKGTLTIDPIAVETKLTIDRLPVSIANAFIPENMTLSIDDGYFNSAYDISIAIDDSSKVIVSAKGGSNIANLKVIEKTGNTTLMSFNDLAVNDLTFDLDPMKVDISEIVLDSFYSNVSISKDKRLNINDALGIEPLPEDSIEVVEEEIVAVEDTVKVPGPDVFIKQIRLVNNSVDFADNSLPLPFITKIEKLNTTIDSIDLKDQQRTDIFLHGIIDDVSTADITGSLYLSDPNYNTDIKITLNKLNLIHYSPFSAKFVGLLIEKGSFSLDLFYKVKNSQLDMKSQVRLNKLTFGEDYPSEDATGLPVKLPIALLKDSDGNIEHDINAKGDLSDPKVSLRGVIFKSVSQILLNIAASPFKLLGKGLSMFTPDDLNHVDFAFASTELDSIEMKKLSGISTALLEKPSLKISIHGVADRIMDKKAIQNKIYNSLITKNTKTPYDSLNTSGRQTLLEKIYKLTSPKPALLDSIKAANIVKLQPAPTPEMHSRLDTLRYIKDVKTNIYDLHKVEDAELLKLTNTRAQNILLHFTQRDSVPADQVEISEGELSQKDGIAKIQCQLDLGAK
ncbi:MAG: DUF748 domain-containing protein [Candidatus Delongbacteria bacterium]|jgi:outer membrane protein OmpA-like peptidoglycan-associated protein|nr:DUF748 domain-containing protein [Candidatus Delongbacteria bacterium]